jgi:hypothetical protein
LTIAENYTAYTENPTVTEKSTPHVENSTAENSTTYIEISAFA